MYFFSQKLATRLQSLSKVKVYGLSVETTSPFSVQQVNMQFPAGVALTVTSPLFWQVAVWSMLAEPKSGLADVTVSSN